ncbi:hypothetical protein NL676_013063 [Syzygium grande]|nr:hypothetical protein NL676_013063 [Syzygium grande]
MRLPFPIEASPWSHPNGESLSIPRLGVRLHLQHARADHSRWSARIGERGPASGLERRELRSHPTCVSSVRCPTPLPCLHQVIIGLAPTGSSERSSSPGFFSAALTSPSCPPDPEQPQPTPSTVRCNICIVTAGLMLPASTSRRDLSPVPPSIQRVSHHDQPWSCHLEMQQRVWFHTAELCWTTSIAKSIVPLVQYREPPHRPATLRPPSSSRSTTMALPSRSRPPRRIVIPSQNPLSPNLEVNIGIREPCTADSRGVNSGGDTC